jgi:hypothetical protein
MKKLSDTTYIVLGVLGGCVGLYGLVMPTPQYAYILGSLLLLVTAVHFKLFYFIALELIISSGHAAILLGIGPNLQVALPVLLCFQLFVYYLITKQLKNIFILLGIAGIALLSIGFSFDNQWIFVVGGMGIASYAYYCVYKGFRPCLIWAILNTLFSLIAFIHIMIGK